VAPLLESYDARGLFFVCPAFADIEREESFRLMERSAGALGETNRDSRWQRLSRAQMVELDRRGHGIGSHTLSHVPLAHISEAEATLEVKQSAELLASWLGHDCHFFSWTYSWDEISEGCDGQPSLLFFALWRPQSLAAAAPPSGAHGRGC
jgi:peptidoglycan/xylan/chitin deacetylase (PgdA/CDA1 family)